MVTDFSLTQTVCFCEETISNESVLSTLVLSEIAKKKKIRVLKGSHFMMQNDHSVEEALHRRVEKKIIVSK